MILIEVLDPENLYNIDSRATANESLFVASTIIKARVGPIDFNKAFSMKDTKSISEFLSSSA